MQLDIFSPDLPHAARDLQGLASAWGKDFWSLESLLESLESQPDSQLLIMRVAGQVMAMVAGHLARPQGEVWYIFVQQDFRGRGLAVPLLEAFLQKAQSIGCQEVCLEVQSVNQPALGLYQSLGFTTYGTRPKYYRDGSDAVLMTRKL